MKKLLLIFCVILIFSLNVSAAKQSTTRPSDQYDIAVTLINQEPDPAEPGKYVDVRFKFDNNGTGKAREMEAEILPDYPFSLDPGREAIKKLGTLQSRQKGDVGVVAKYRLKVDENAVEGENELRIRYRIDKGVWIELEEFMVDVQTHDAILSVDSVSLTKDTLEPGSSNTIEIKLSNKADSILKDVKVRLEFGGLPFAPLGSTNEKSIYQIPARDDYEFSFKVLANPEAESGVYQVPLKIAYSDGLGKSYFRNDTIGLIIGAKPDLSVTLDESEIFEAENSGEVIIKVVNKGVIDIKFANIKLIHTDDYKVLSTNEVYLGNIDSDDFETADFNIFVEKTEEEHVVLPVVLEYKDANNNDFKDAIELKLSLYSASEAKKFGLKNGNGLIGTLIAITIVIAGLFYYRKYYKEKKKA